MNEIEKYLLELKKEVRDLPKPMQEDVLIEVQTHIEDGLEDEESKERTGHDALLRELGSPTELVRNLHWANWKRNGRNAAFAIIPLLLLNPLSAALDRYVETNSSSTILHFAIQFMICLGMILLAQYLQSRLLVGWWVANTFGTIWSAFTHSIILPFNWLPEGVWQLALLALVILVGGFYGRFLYQNRFDGLTVSTTLLPFMWGAIEIFSIRPLVIMQGFVWRQMWSGALISVAWILIVLITFVYPGRMQRWLLLFACYAICSVGSVAIWLPNPNAGIWLFLMLPFLLGLGIELASNRHYKRSTLTASA